ncbi:hypothetical protein B7P43_G02976 [Cryptotermes secundus]|uniref:Uncharacterized protein n=1 Tax=Cryptotermes secundus TaxID=105785 RepID=A0A2J7PLX3_9NEOP|nr:hypothetical protein B7P43_G02976 [Cryptotermes secundus]
MGPGYRSKPENFDPAKVGKRQNPKPKLQHGPKTPTVTSATNLQTKVSEQDEFVPGTKFNLKYLHNLSDIVGKLTFKNLTTAEGESQAIKTKPVDGCTGQRNPYNQRQQP